MTLPFSMTRLLLVILYSSFESNAFVPSVHLSNSKTRISSPTENHDTFILSHQRTHHGESCEKVTYDVKSHKFVQHFNRKDFLISSIVFAPSFILPTNTMAKCADIESCREIGERKVEQDMIDNPTLKTRSGVRYKVLQPGINEDSKSMMVQPDSNIDLIFSISTLSGGYMYSRGFGFETIDVGNGQLQSDLGLDSLRVQLGKQDLPLGIEEALIGMRKGERRRVELPPRLGFETSDWKPEPTSRRGKARIVGYKQLLYGNGSSRPGFPAATIWDVEVLRIRN